MLCSRCGQLNESDASQCESCYAPLDATSMRDIDSVEECSSPYEISRMDKSTNSLAAAGMLLGIGGIVSCCSSPFTGLYIPGILGFLGLIMSLVGKKQIAEKEIYEGKLLATLGIVFGTVSLLGSIITIILFLLGVMAWEGIGDYLPHIK